LGEVKKMTFSAQAYVLTNQIQPYAWGERGPSAFLARFLNLTNVAENAPLAELWMGTHPLGTSTLKDGDNPVLLSEIVQRYPTEILGQRVAAAFAGQFPFLLKILSANEPLSIQLHPSKEQAVALRQKDPAHYPDDNHKPEIAIALEHLDALAGLRDARQIAALMAQYPVLAKFVAFESLAQQPKSKQPRLAFQSLLQQAMKVPDEMARVITQIAASIQAKSKLSYREKLFIKMNGQYPGDVGLLSILFLKLHHLRKGQAMFIPAGVPHAYLKGNIVECMASSDNVIRGGLTPKIQGYSGPVGDHHRSTSHHFYSRCARLHLSCAAPRVSHPQVGAAGGAKHAREQRQRAHFAHSERQTQVDLGGWRAEHNARRVCVAASHFEPGPDRMFGRSGDLQGGCAVGIYDLRFTIYDLRFTIYDLRFTIRL
jgi:mannose-6-phosphate isomerase